MLLRVGADCLAVILQGVLGGQRVLRDERSLAMLTGLTHDYDPDDWTAWLTSSVDPFASAGHVPGSLAPPRQTWCERTKRVFGR